MPDTQKPYRTDFYQAEESAAFIFREAFQAANGKWNIVEISRTHISVRGLLKQGQQRSLIRDGVERDEAKSLLFDFARTHEGKARMVIAVDAFGMSKWQNFQHM